MNKTSKTVKCERETFPMPCNVSEVIYIIHNNYVDEDRNTAQTFSTNE